MPLVDISEENGPTEFWPGTHFPWKLPADAPQPLRLAPLKRGDAIVYDSRLFHRGTANRSAELRPVAYWLYEREHDDLRLPDGSLADPNYDRNGWPSVFARDAPLPSKKREIT